MISNRKLRLLGEKSRFDGLLLPNPPTDGGVFRWRWINDSLLLPTSMNGAQLPLPFLSLWLVRM